MTQQLSREHLKGLVESSKNGLEVAEILLRMKPPCREGLLHTILEDVHCKTQKIVLEFCAE